MKKSIAFALTFIFMMSACSVNKTPVEISGPENDTHKETQNQESQEKPQVIDAFGREVQFEELPTRIVIAGRQTPMLVNFLYLFKTAADKILAIERRGQSADDFLAVIDPGIKSKYILERDASVEQIAPLDPDLVILKTTMRQSIGLGIEDVGIPVVYIEFESVDQIYRDLEVFAVLLGEEDRGAGLVTKYKQINSEINAKVSPADTRPNVVLAQTEEKDSGVVFSVPPQAWLQTAMINELGANPLWTESNQGGGWVEVNIEQIINWDPDYFFLINYEGNGPSVVESIINDPLWQNISAIKMNQIYSFGYDFLSWDQPDPRWILGYSWMASKLYPEHVTSETVSDIVHTFYADFYGFDEDEYEEIIVPRITPYFE